MFPLTYLPIFFRTLLRGLPGVFRWRHSLYFSWLLLMQSVVPGRKTLTHMARYTPRHIAEHHFRRVLSAAYWSVKLLLGWFADQAIQSLPPPQDGVVYLIGDGSHKDKRGKKHPVVQKGRISKHTGYFLGIKFVLLMVCWDVYRIPVDFELVLPKDHKAYQNENTLFRAMVAHFLPPSWAKLVVVVGDCAFASKANMRLIQKRNKEDRTCEWGFVFGIARTWKQEDGKSLKDLVTYLPRQLYRKTWIPKIGTDDGRKTFWVFRKRTRLRHLGDVTIVLSKKRRNDGPKQTKLIVTNLTPLKTQEVVRIYNRRWQVEILIKELKSGLGLGQHQVTGEVARTEKSFSIALLAYLLVLRAQRKDIKPGKSWSMFHLQRAFTARVMEHELQHRETLLRNKLLKVLKKVA